MSQMVRKATTAEIVNHWMLAVSCILLIITGYAFVFKIEGIYALFGSNATMKVVHNWTGAIFTVSLLGTVFNYLGEALDLGSDDWNWMRMGGGYLSKKTVAVPPMGKINTGQKFYYLAILVGGTGHRGLRFRDLAAARHALDHPDLAPGAQPGLCAVRDGRARAHLPRHPGQPGRAQDHDRRHGAA